MRAWLHTDGVSFNHRGRSLWISWAGLMNWGIVRHSWLFLTRRID